MTDEILELELRLMVVRHGRQRLLITLARLGSQSVEELEREITAFSERRASGKKVRKQRSAAELIDEAAHGRPEIKAFLTPLVTRFENRTFLPQLRDVVRFLDGAGVSHGKLKSRTASLQKVLAALSQRSVDELRQLATSAPSDSDSDFLMLAREIMAGGRPRRPEQGERG